MSNKTHMTMNYNHIYDLLAGGPITGEKEFISRTFNDIHSLLVQTFVGSNKL